MKRLFIFLTVVLLPVAVHAQDKNLFNHMALGLSAGTDGLSLEAATPVTDFLILRGGYGNLSLIKPAKYSHAFDVDSDDPWDIHGPVSATFRPTIDNIHALVDIFPTRTGAFRLTLGGYYMLSKKGIVHGNTDKPLPIDKEDYMVTGVKFTDGNQVEYATTDEKGFLNADIRFRNGRVVPYAGIGFSRAVCKGWVRFLFDMGVLYTGGYDAYTYDYGIAGNPATPKPVKLTSQKVDNKDGNILDTVSGLPVYPVLRFSFFARIF